MISRWNLIRKIGREVSSGETHSLSWAFLHFRVALHGFSRATDKLLSFRLGSRVRAKIKVWFWSFWTPNKFYLAQERLLKVFMEIEKWQPVSLRELPPIRRSRTQICQYYLRLEWTELFIPVQTWFHLILYKNTFAQSPCTSKSEEKHRSCGRSSSCIGIPLTLASHTKWTILEVLEA